MQLRDYQQASIDQIYDWFQANQTGNPCLVLPTGAGKSHVIAAFCKGAVQTWPSTRILMLTHVAELIAQNAEKMIQHWPNAPLGIYAAGLRRREAGNPITFGSVQTLAGKEFALGHIDLVIIDECHLVSHKDEGRYRSMIAALTEVNPALRVVGLTATPYRMGHGYISEGGAIFDDLLQPVSVEELVHRGYLSILRSKQTVESLDTSGIAKRGGEFIERDLQLAVDLGDLNHGIAKEIARRAGDRRSWLVFCTGVEHSEHISERLQREGVRSAVITGKTPKGERDRLIKAHKTGEITALCNANVLTTGYDNPNIDLIAMVRPTLSPGLYVQMAGRGLRLKEHTDHCLVLDFAGNVARHGPITAVLPPRMAGKGEAPTKVCENCFEIVPLSARQCASCGAVFPEPEAAEKDFSLRNDDIMGIEVMTEPVDAWRFSPHLTKSGLYSVKCVYKHGADLVLQGEVATQYFSVCHPQAGRRARSELNAIVAGRLGRDVMAKRPMEQKDDELPDVYCFRICDIMNNIQAPRQIRTKQEGKYKKVLKQLW